MMSEWLKNNWFDIVKLAITIFGVGGICSKVFINKYEKRENEKEVRKEEEKAKTEGIVEGMQSLLRSEILRTYYNAMAKNYLYQWERENLDKNFKAYIKVHGNAFIEDAMEQLGTLEVKPNNYYSKQK